MTGQIVRPLGQSERSRAHNRSAVEYVVTDLRRSRDEPIEVQLHRLVQTLREQSDDTDCSKTESKQTPPAVL